MIAGPNEAAAHLAYVERLSEQTRLRVAHSYPYFVIWGAAWTAGNVCQALGIDWAWSIVIPVATLVQAWAIWRHSRTNAASRSVPRSPAFTMTMIYLAGIFLVGAIFVFPRDDPSITTAFYPVAFGVLWVAMGAYAGRAWAYVGAWSVAVGAASLGLSEEAAPMLIAVALGVPMIGAGVWIQRYIRPPQVGEQA